MSLFEFSISLKKKSFLKAGAGEREILLTNWANYMKCYEVACTWWYQFSDCSVPIYFTKV
jgi:hypothetical protein